MYFNIRNNLLNDYKNTDKYFEFNFKLNKMFLIRN